MITDVQLRGQAREIVKRVRERIVASDAYGLAEPTAARERPALHALLDEVASSVERIADAVGDGYLQHLQRIRA